MPLTLASSLAAAWALGLPASQPSHAPLDPVLRRLVAPYPTTWTFEAAMAPVVLEPDPRVLGRPDIALLVRTARPDTTSSPNMGAIFLGELLASGIGSAASPYTIIGPNCGFGSATAGLLGSDLPPAHADGCLWGDWEARYPKDMDLQVLRGER